MAAVPAGRYCILSGQQWTSRLDQWCRDLREWTQPHGHDHTDTVPEDLWSCWIHYIRGVELELEHHQQLSIMHRAFESDDIIYSVLEHLKSSPTDLVNVATTCSRLAGPALDILWSKQSSLVPLVKCLPRDAWKVKNQTIVSEVYHLSLNCTMLTVL
jgi:hypothetical protein